MALEIAMRDDGNSRFRVVGSMIWHIEVGAREFASRSACGRWFSHVGEVSSGSKEPLCLNCQAVVARKMTAKRRRREIMANRKSSNTPLGPWPAQRAGQERAKRAVQRGETGKPRRDTTGNWKKSDEPSVGDLRVLAKRRSKWHVVDVIPSVTMAQARERLECGFVCEWVPRDGRFPVVISKDPKLINAFRSSRHATHPPR